MIRLRALALVAAAGLGLTACTDGYGYSGVSLGYGGGYGGYGDVGFYDDGYNGAWGSPYWGWYGDSYYPGTGAFVYDRYNRRTPWNAYQQRYWEGRRQNWRGDRREIRDNWQDFRRDRRVDDRAYRMDRRDDRQAFRRGEVTREAYRAERRDDRRDYNREYRRDRQALRRENRRDRRD